MSSPPTGTSSPSPAIERSASCSGCAKSHGLPRPRANTWIGKHEVDFYWPEAQLALEFDGGAVHRTTKAFHEDRKRDRALAARGIHVVRATAKDEPPELAEELRIILSVRTPR